MNKRIDLATLLEGSGKNRAEQVALFALINLGIVESLSNGLLSAAECLQIFFHADNCLFVRKRLRVRAADQIMSHGVQLPDLFDALPTGSLLGYGKQLHAENHVTVSSSLFAVNSASSSGISPYASARIFSGWIVGFVVPCSI